jgi:hypothetical protein
MKAIKYFLAVEDPVRLEKALYVSDRLCWRLIFKTARPKTGIGHLHRVARHRKSHDAHSGGLTEGAGNCWVRACLAVFVWGRDPNPVPCCLGWPGPFVEGSYQDRRVFKHFCRKNLQVRYGFSCSGCFMARPAKSRYCVGGMCRGGTPNLVMKRQIGVVCVKFCKFFHGITGKFKQLATENGPTQSSSEVARCVFH